jgi:thioesterase domain-containing protein/acyl carrier protein
MNVVESFPKTIAEPVVVGEFPCTQTQLRYWIQDQLSPGNPALNVAVRWEIRGWFRAGSIEAAFRKVIQRHEVLRTRLVERDGDAVQQVVEQIDFKMAEIDLRNMAPDQRQAKIHEIGEEAARAPFDLTKPGLLRASLVMVENDFGVLLITAHHSCFDGWSIRVLGREVGEIAAAIDANRAPVLPELPLQYGDFALWQEEYLTGYGFEVEKAFWSEKLAGVPYFEVTPDLPRTAQTSSRGNIIAVGKSLAFGKQLDEQSRRHQVTQFGYGAAVVSAMLSRFTGNPMVLLGFQVAGRDHSELENLIGVFINSLVLRFDFAPQATFDDHIKKARETIEAALTHQQMPFNKLVEIVNPVRDPSRNPLISVNFNLQKSFLEDNRYGRFELLGAPSQSSGVIYDLNFIMVERPSGWRMSIEYNTDLFETSTIDTLLNLWQETFELAFRDSAAPISSLAAPLRDIAGAGNAGDANSIEQLLRGHPSVDAAVVIANAKGSRGAYAFVTPSSTFADVLDHLPSSLMQHLEERLPPEAMPQGISVLLNFPRTASGAINRAELRIPAPLKISVPTQVAAPAVDPGPEALPQDIETLREIWRNVLGVSAVEADDDFFELGGHSLLALRMLSAVRKTFDVKPSLELLFQHPTLGAFAGAALDRPKSKPIASDDSNFWERVTCKSGTGPLAVYTINHPYLYYRLANELSDNVSVYNINMFHADLDEKLSKLSFSEIAARAVEAMDIQPGNPVAIVGLCVNGTMAMEVTRQLRARGIDVSVTAVIDSWAPGFVRSQPKLRQKLWNGERRVKRLAYFTQKVASGRMPVLRYLKEFNVTLKLTQMLGIKGAEYSPEEVATVKVTDLLVTASRSYRPVPGEDDRVVLLRSQAHPRRAGKLLFGWGNAVAKTTPVLDVAGWHEDSLTSDGIKQLASALSGKLESAAR